jgi:hypothetical protein
VFSPLLGLSPERAEEWLKAHPTPCPGNPRLGLGPQAINVVFVRPTMVDGQGVAVTADLRSDRVNVVVEHGLITSIDEVG